MSDAVGLENKVHHKVYHEVYHGMGTMFYNNPKPNACYLLVIIYGVGD